jgi:porin
VRWTLCLLAAVLICVWPVLVLARDTPSAPSQGLLPIPDYSGDLWSRSFLAGDPGGERTKLAERGVQFNADYTQVYQSVVDGGRSTGNAYGGNLDYQIHLDLMRMGVLPGALIAIRAETRYGTTVNGRAGAILPSDTDGYFPLTKQLDKNVPIAVTDLNYTQFLSEHFAVLLGKIDTLDGDLNEFASGRGTSQFLNANFLFNPVIALRLPYSTLGAGIIVLPTKTTLIKSIVFNTPDSSETSGFDEFGHGGTWVTEADVQYRLGDLPGGMNVGGVYSFDQDFTQINGELIFQPGEGLVVPKKNSTWAAYWSGWQYLLVKDPNDKPIDLMNGSPDHEGFGLFARAGLADQDTNPTRWSASAGVGGRGMIPTRDNDTFGVGYYYTSIQRARIGGLLGIQAQSQGFEAFYNVAITPAAHLTFDAQWQDPALPKIASATILGMRLNLSF